MGGNRNLGDALYFQKPSGTEDVGLGVRVFGDEPADPAQYLTMRLSNGQTFYTAAGVTVSGAAVLTADQGAPNTLSSAWPIKVTDGSTVYGTRSSPIYTLLASGSRAVGFTEVGGTPALRVDVVQSALSSGAATETGLQSVTASIDSLGALISGRLGTVGQKTMAASTPVAIASDQSTVPVSIVDATVVISSSIHDVLSVGNSFSASLAADEVLLGDWEDVSGIAAISVLVYTTQNSAVNGAEIQFSDDGHNVRRSSNSTIIGGIGVSFSFPRAGRYFRIKYTNGSSPGTGLAQTIFHGTALTNPQTALAASTTDLTNAILAKSFLVGRTSLGTWIPLHTTTAGDLRITGTVTLSESVVSVQGQSGSTAWKIVDDTIGTVDSTSPTNASLVAGSDGANIRALRTDATGELQIDVLTSALPAGAATEATLESIALELSAKTEPGDTQMVSGTVAVSNFPDVQSVTGPLTDVQLRASAVTIEGTVTAESTSGTLNNGSQTTVSSTAVQVLAANPSRKMLIVQNVGPATVRVSATGVTATTGIQLGTGATLTLAAPHCPTNAIFAIREGSTDSIVFATEVI